MGSVIRETTTGPDGKTVRKRYLPIGVTVDERVCAGVLYARMMDRMMYYCGDPSLLEAPPATVRFEEGCAYSLPDSK